MMHPQPPAASDMEYPGSLLEGPISMENVFDLLSTCSETSHGDSPPPELADDDESVELPPEPHPFLPAITPAAHLTRSTTRRFRNPMSTGQRRKKDRSSIGPLCGSREKRFRRAEENNRPQSEYVASLFHSSASVQYPLPPVRVPCPPPPSPIVPRTGAPPPSHEQSFEKFLSGVTDDGPLIGPRVTPNNFVRLPPSPFVNSLRPPLAPVPPQKPLKPLPVTLKPAPMTLKQGTEETPRSSLRLRSNSQETTKNQHIVEQKGSADEPKEKPVVMDDELEKLAVELQDPVEEKEPQDPVEEKEPQDPVEEKEPPKPMSPSAFLSVEYGNCTQDSPFAPVSMDTENMSPNVNPLSPSQMVSVELEDPQGQDKSPLTPTRPTSLPRFDKVEPLRNGRVTAPTARLDRLKSVVVQSMGSQNYITPGEDEEEWRTERRRKAEVERSRRRRSNAGSGGATTRSDWLSCSFCRLRFETLSHLHQHEVQVHKKLCKCCNLVRRLCPDCGSSFTNQKEWADHRGQCHVRLKKLSSVISKNLSSILSGGESSSGSGGGENSVEEIIVLDDDDDDKEEVEVKVKEDVDEEDKKQESEVEDSPSDSSLYCSTCDEEFESQKSLTRHRKEAHDSSSKSSSTGSSRSSSGQPQSTCSLCGEMFSGGRAFRVHRRECTRRMSSEEEEESDEEENVLGVHDEAEKPQGSETKSLVDVDIPADVLSPGVVEDPEDDPDEALDDDVQCNLCGQEFDSEKELQDHEKFFDGKCALVALQDVLQEDENDTIVGEAVVEEDDDEKDDLSDEEGETIT